MHVLDGNSVEVLGVGFAGVKGFAGGFGRGALGPWGEGVIKLFVQEALNEALKLETALARLRPERRVVLLHYSPIEGTVVGEPKEIYPYLGSSGWRSRSAATRWTPCSTATRITALRRGGRRTTCRSTTCR